MQKSLAAVGVSLLGMGSIAVPSIAVATTPECGASETGKVVTFASGICQAEYSTNGAFAFTVPSGATELAAIVVGAGAGADLDGSWGYAGDGGQVRYLDLSQTAPAGTLIPINVGDGGTTGATPTAGQPSSLTIGSVVSSSAGGIGQDQNNYCALEGSFSTYLGNGNGAGGPPVKLNNDHCGTTGPGLAPLANTQDNFSNIAPTIFFGFLLELGKGGYVAATPSPLAQSPGQGGSIEMNLSTLVSTSSLNGSDGLVVLRWKPAVVAPVAPAVVAPVVAAPAVLAVTGVASYEASTVALFSSFVIAIGAAFTAFSFRMRRRTS